MQDFTEVQAIDELYECSQHEDRCEALQTIKLFALPPILVIHLKRFTNYLKKNNCKVRVPFDSLDLSPYVQQKDNIPQNYIYKLYAFITHAGTRRPLHSLLPNRKRKMVQFSEK